ncbi:MAG: hypothetical protein E6L07_06615 [Verrucomicrobia bacterium]|nr:MAG: hypothetical protein E6L07_06615 [Verrucomicrobiota bacterium]
MADEKKMPKGGRKGGAQFPQAPLGQAIQFAKKLVAKTHTGAQPENIILKGVFNSSGPTGKVRASALKQYGLMQGETSAYDATKLAQSINSAPPEELPPLLREAFLHPRVFKALFDTFQNDVVSRAKIRQQALQLKVHPDSGEKCVDLFVESAVYAGLASEKDDEIQISSSASPSKAHEDDLKDTEESDILGAQKESTDGNEGDKSEEVILRKSAKTVGGQMNISITLDSTMDPEKLEKYLKLLREYGAIG